MFKYLLFKLENFLDLNIKNNRNIRESKEIYKILK